MSFKRDDDMYSNHLIEYFGIKYSGTRHSEWEIVTDSQTTLYCQSWLPTGMKAQKRWRSSLTNPDNPYTERLSSPVLHEPVRPKVIIGIVHGLGSHSGMFGTVVEHFTSIGYGIFGLDLRGHGRSPGQRGYIHRWNDFRSDIHQFLQMIMTHYPDTPLFLWGHSLGGLISLDFVMRCGQESLKPNGLIVTAPALGASGVSPIRLWIGQLLSKIWPRFSLDTGLGKIPPCHNPAISNAILNDPLCHHLGTARLATEFQKTARWVQTHTNQLNVPILILHGSKDLVIPPESSRLFFEQLEIMDKKRKEYKETYHEIHLDNNYFDVLTDAQQWINQHLSSKS